MKRGFLKKYLEKVRSRAKAIDLLKKLGVKKQVFLLILVFCAAFSVNLISALVQQRQLTQSQTDFFNQQFLPYKQLSQYESMVNKIRLVLTEVVAEIVPGPGGANKIGEQISEINTVWKLLKPNLEFSSNEKIIALLEKVQSGHESLNEISIEAQEYASQHDLESIKDLLEDDWVSVIINIDKPIKEIYKIKLDMTSNVRLMNKEKGEFFEVFSLSLGFTILGLIILFGYTISNYLSKSSQTTINILKSVTKSSQHNMEQMQSTALVMENQVSDQNSLMTETLESLSSISDKAKTSVTIADETLNQMHRTSLISDEGQKSIESLKQYMEDFGDSFQDLEQKITENNEKMLSIVNVIDNVSQKTTLINDIVFQTKLLSFNASVEAARAGDQGKGFAVVAEEVGNLAQMSGQAAQEINRLIIESKEHVTSVVNELQDDLVSRINRQVGSVKEAIELTKNSDQSLITIVNSIDHVSKLMQDLSIAAKEQEGGVESIEKSMEQMSNSISTSKESTSKNIKFSEEAGENCRDLEVAMKQLTSTVSGEKKSA